MSLDLDIPWKAHSGFLVVFVVSAWPHLPLTDVNINPQSQYLFLKSAVCPQSLLGAENFARLSRIPTLARCPSAGILIVFLPP
jgi:hypothetical protein